MLNLSEYRQKPKHLVDYLPWAALIGPGLILNKDGSLQRTCRYRGPDLESSTPEQLVSYIARVNNALRRFGSGWALFFEAARRPAQGYPETGFEDDASWLVDEERRATFEAAGAHFETDFYLTLTWMPPADRAGRVESLLIEDPSDAPEAFWRDNLERFDKEAARSFDLIETLMPEVSWLSDEETLTYLHDCVSVKRHRLRVPDTPMHLDGLLADCGFSGGLAPELGGHAVRSVSVLGFPPQTEPALLADLDHLGFSYRWMTRFLPLDKPEAEKILNRYRRQWFAKRKSVMTIIKETLENEPAQLVNTDADNKAADVDEALQALGADHASFGYLTTTITVMDPSPEIADERARAIERILGAHGFATITETVNAVEAWLGTHPGNAYANVRQPLLHTINLAHMAPLSAIWAGPEDNKHLKGPPLLMARSATNTPFRLVTHQGDVGHTMIVGPTGAGKSVLLSLISMQFRRYVDARVFIFDKGRSARAAILAMGGEDYNLSLEGGLSFQPLAAIDNERERAMAQSWLLGLLEQEGVDLTPAIREAIYSALVSLSEAPEHQRTLTGLAALVQSSDLRQALQPYTLDGPYGSLLDADTDSLRHGNAAVFEMEDLLHDPRLAAPVLSYLFHRLEERFDGAPTLLILDEAWTFLDHPMFAARIREWLKTLRKKNVSVVFATQSLADIATSDISAALIESCLTRIFLPNARAEEPGQMAAYDAFGLNERQIQLIARSTPKRDYYLQCPAGNRLFDLEMGDVALAFCSSSSKADQAAIDEILETTSPGNSFAAAWLAAKGLDWAADLILQQDNGDVPCAAE
ncbi:MAG: conjugal transfer protein TrbE [Pseudomonadota bacterium]